MTRCILKIFSSEEEWETWVRHNSHRIVRVQEVKKSGKNWYVHYFISEADFTQLQRLTQLQAELSAFEPRRTVPADLTQNTAANLIQAWSADLNNHKGGKK